MKTIMMFLLMLVFLCSCSQMPKALTDQQKNEIITEIQKLADELLTDSQKLSTDALQKYLSDKEELTFKMGGKLFSKTDLIEAVKKEYITFKSQTLTVQNQKIIVLSDKAVLWVSDMLSKAIDQSGKEGQSVLHETWLWEKENGTWKVTHFDEYWF
ncbi:MAG TPA: nuclear transport factor 2 family protein [Candidatus Cloacimonadota bacterium]|nr:nuclear transport factor 2 family protein [Candidatus Cloacimonadota bacterium]